MYVVSATVLHLKTGRSTWRLITTILLGKLEAYFAIIAIAVLGFLVIVPKYCAKLPTTLNNMTEPSRPTDQLIDELELMIARRMANTGESRIEACEHIQNYIKKQYND